MMSHLSQGQRMCHKMIRRLDKEKLQQILYYDNVLCPSLYTGVRSVHLQRRMPLHSDYNAQTSTTIERFTNLSTPILVRQVSNVTETNAPPKKAGILKKILKISLGSVVALLTTGGLLIAKKVYEDEDDPVSPDNLTAPGRKSDINKEWVEFMLTSHENKQRPGTKVTVNNFEVGDATQQGDGYAGEHVKLLVNATIQTAENQDQPGLIYEKDYDLFVKLLNPHPVMQQTMKYHKSDLNDLLVYSDLMDDLQKFQASKTEEDVCFNTPGFIYGKWTDKQFVLVMENMKTLGFGQNPKEKSFNLHQAKLGLEQIARLHALTYAYDKEKDIKVKFSSYIMEEGLQDLLVLGYDKYLETSILFLKGRENTEGIIDKISSSRSKLIEKSKQACHFDSKIKCLVHSDCWNNNFLFKTEKDENGKDTFINSEKMLMLDFQAMNYNIPFYDLIMFMYCTTEPQLRKEHLEEMLMHYYSTFSDVLNKLKCTEYFWTYEQFKSEYERYYPLCLYFGFAAAVVKSEAIKEMSLGKSDPGPSGPIWTKIKAAAAKLIVPLVMHPIFVELFIGGLINSITEELIAGKNKVFCDLWFDVLLEAEENGTFDESR